MEKKESVTDKHSTFALLLIITNRMETLMTRDLKEFDVTTKQWFLSATINSVFEEPPTIKEAANVMGSSHQNIKQIALKLEQKGLLKLEKDQNDARVTRLRATEQSTGFWEKTVPKGEEFIHRMYEEIGEDELEVTKKVLDKIASNLNEME